MPVKIRYLNKKGDTPLELTPEEAQELVDAEEGKYFVVDAETRQILHEVEVKNGQNLVLMPVVRGG